ncbi:uncharacterized protein AMSG_01025, partial [Thecamonas trahens ATCC 50062]
MATAPSAAPAAPPAQQTQVVWARMASWPAWPALRLDAVDENTNSGEESKWRCAFFGSYDNAVITSRNIKPFAATDDVFGPASASTSKSKKKPRKRKKLLKALREAKEFLASGIVPQVMKVRYFPEPSPPPASATGTSGSSGPESLATGDDDKPAENATEPAFTRSKEDMEGFERRRAFRLKIMSRLGLSAVEEVVEGDWCSDLIRKPGLSANALFSSPPAEVLGRKRRRKSSVSQVKGADDDGGKEDSLDDDESDIVLEEDDDGPPAKKSKSLSGKASKTKGSTKSSKSKSSKSKSSKSSTGKRKRVLIPWTNEEYEAIKAGVLAYHGPERGKWNTIYDSIKDKLHPTRHADHLSRKWATYRRALESANIPVPQFNIAPTKREIAESAGPTIQTLQLWTEDEVMNLINAAKIEAEPLKRRWHRVLAKYGKWFKPFRRPSDLSRKYARHLANRDRTVTITDPDTGAESEVLSDVAKACLEIEERASKVTTPVTFGDEFDVPELRNRPERRKPKPKKKRKPANQSNKGDNGKNDDKNDGDDNNDDDSNGGGNGGNGDSKVVGKVADKASKPSIANTIPSAFARAAAGAMP